MVILGLGSNSGDRLHHLTRALQALKAIPSLSVKHVSPVYLSDALLTENAPPEWNMPYLNLAIRCETTLAPLGLLQEAKRIEAEIGRVVGHVWGPRPIDIDILAWDDRVIVDDKLHIPHEHLLERPFALWPLTDVAPHWVYPLPHPHPGTTATEIAARWGSRFSGDAPLHTQQLPHRIDTAELVGILNVTPDSFSDGGQLSSAAAALSQASALVTAGATVLDIGAEATGPTAQPLSPELEWQRLEPVLTLLLAKKNTLLIPPRISVDTRHVSTAQKALALGVDWINDVSGLSDPAMCELVQTAQCDIVIMHQLGIPQHNSVHLPLTDDPCSIVYQWAENLLETLSRRGIATERLIVDVGIGFGKTAAQSLALLQQMGVFQQLSVRLLVGHSRKSFLRYSRHCRLVSGMWKRLPPHCIYLGWELIIYVCITWVQRREH